MIQRTYTYTREADERGPENEEVTFSDNNALPMTADVQLVMRIDPSKAPALYKRYRLTFDQMFEGPIRNDVRSSIAAETELVSVEFLYRGGRQQVIQKPWRASTANGRRKASISANSTGSAPSATRRSSSTRSR